MYRDDSVDPPLLVCQVGSTRLSYLARAVDDLHEWLRERGDWVPLGAAGRAEGRGRRHGRGVGSFGENPVGGWYGTRKGYRGRFGMYLPPLLEALGLARAHPRRPQQLHASPSDQIGCLPPSGTSAARSYGFKRAVRGQTRRIELRHAGNLDLRRTRHPARGGSRSRSVDRNRRDRAGGCGLRVRLRPLAVPRREHAEARTASATSSSGSSRRSATRSGRSRLATSSSPPSTTAT